MGVNATDVNKITVVDRSKMVYTTVFEGVYETNHIEKTRNQYINQCAVTLTKLSFAIFICTFLSIEREISS